MKTTVYLLLIINLAVFGWVYTQRTGFEPVAQITAPPLPANIEPLQLLSERGGNAAETAAPAPLNDIGTAPGVELETASADDRSPDAASVTEDAAPAAQGAEVEPPTTEAESTPVTEPAPPPPAPVMVCQVIGPFQSRAELDRFVAALGDAPIVTEVRAAQMEYPADYWVYLPEMGAAEARSAMRDLAAKGVEDTFLGRQNTISLGVFSDQRTAQTRARNIARLGYEPKVEARFKTRDVFWIDAEEQVPNILDETQWSAHLADWKDIRRQPVSCE